MAATVSGGSLSNIIGRINRFLLAEGGEGEKKAIIVDQEMVKHLELRPEDKHINGDPKIQFTTSR